MPLLNIQLHACLLILSCLREAEVEYFLKILAGSAVRHNFGKPAVVTEAIIQVMQWQS